LFAHAGAFGHAANKARLTAAEIAGKADDFAASD
jgi:hypothetical protein